MSLAALPLLAAVGAAAILERCFAEHCSRKTLQPRVAVGGLSSGAAFAVQFHVAHSEMVSGMAVFAPQPYRCAIQRFPEDPLEDVNPEVPHCTGCEEGKTIPYDHCLQTPEVVDVTLLQAAAQDYATRGLIDNLTHLARDRIYMYRGTKDAICLSGSTENTRDFFAEFLENASSQILMEVAVPSGHAIPVTGWVPWPCGLPPLHGFPLQNCAYDAAGIALRHVFGHDLADPGDVVWSSLMWFDQEPFHGDDSNNNDLDVGLARWGLVYIPQSCKQQGSNETCDLFVSFHGCGFVVPGTFELLVTQQNLNNWAETNRIVVLYPRLRSHGLTIQHQNGCWHANGQTGPDYATRRAPQMLAIRKMIEEVHALKLHGSILPFV
ncbi:unnamed protein product [Polarella glacialis]|uniref:Feruloyl esterase n=1 Tax=Polarella glacialis TaxID=89957 RepID=A0A813H2U4_POLGL|nr:unnamed protein product [Polarella glacialis]CAE8698581.1 unnamed protein product [Polarella glacialis]